MRRGRNAAGPAPADRKSREYRQWRKRQSDRYGDSGLAPEEEGDYRKAQTAVALLKEFAKGKQQFFLAVAQSRPHTPLVAPKQYIDMYDPAKIPDPPAPVEKLVKFPYMKRATGGNPDIFTEKQPTPQQVREAIAAYYACVSFVDDNVGMILDALDEAGLAENTIVVFLGDHGFHLGDHGCWSKYSMLEATRARGADRPRARHAGQRQGLPRDRRVRRSRADARRTGEAPVAGEPGRPQHRRPCSWIPIVRGRRPCS